MKLSQLLEQISPLPHLAGVTQTANDAIYKAHAANVLPHLIAGIRNVVAQHDKYPSKGSEGNCECGNCKTLKAALSLAEEVKT